MYRPGVKSKKAWPTAPGNAKPMPTNEAYCAASSSGSASDFLGGHRDIVIDTQHEDLVDLLAGVQRVDHRDAGGDFFGKATERVLRQGDVERRPAARLGRVGHERLIRRSELR